jgi:aryl-alcohol dehydrogenase-like predicted oxidoreductase
MDTRKLGNTGPEVSAIGLGLMGMSDMYGPADETESIATVHAALDAGITLLDTGDFYGMGHNELLLSRALTGRNRDAITISVKFGAQRGPDGSWLGYDARPAAVKTAAAYSLKRLKTDRIDIYRPARLDPNVAIEETVGAIAELIEAGYVRHVGLSEVGPETIRRAHAVHPIADLQIEYSLLSRGVEAEILAVTRQLGISITAYGVLSRGLLSGHWAKDRDTTASDFRAHSPRFQGENLEVNLRLVDALREVAAARQATVAQIAIAWVASRGQDIVALVGARRRDRLTEALGALDVQLSGTDLAAIETAIPPGSAAGERYAAPQLASLDSEPSRRPASNRTANDGGLTRERILEAAEDVLRRYGSPRRPWSMSREPSASVTAASAGTSGQGRAARRGDRAVACPDPPSAHAAGARWPYWRSDLD